MLSKLASLLILVLIFVGACTNNTNEKIVAPVEDEEETTVEADSVVSLQGMAKDKVDAWLAYIHPDYTLSIDSFKLNGVWIEDSLLPIDYSNAADFLELYQPFLIESADKNYALDLDSYNIILSKNQDNEIEGYSGEPDAQVFLIDNNLNKKFRLLFFGPGNHIDEAYWLDNETFILMGVFNESHDADPDYVPIIYKINIKENLFEKYNYEAAVAGQILLDYTKHIRYKGITIR